MSRSLFKGPLLADSLNTNTHQKIQLFNKNLTILPEYLHKTFAIYNGKKFFKIKVKENMIGYRFGEFIFTRSKYSYKKKK